MRKVSPGVWTVLALAVLVLLWQWAAAGGHINAFYFSSPAAVWQTFRELMAAGTLQKHLLQRSNLTSDVNGHGSHPFSF